MAAALSVQAGRKPIALLAASCGTQGMELHEYLDNLADRVEREPAIWETLSEREVIAVAVLRGDLDRLPVAYRQTLDGSAAMKSALDAVMILGPKWAMAVRRARDLRDAKRFFGTAGDSGQAED
jgi:hypothetical protein